MRYELFISLRYLKAKRKQVFISIITLLSMAGVGLGVMALIVVLSVMSGFEEDLKKKILGTNAHLVVLQQGAGMRDYRGDPQKGGRGERGGGRHPFYFHPGHAHLGKQRARDCSSGDRSGDRRKSDQHRETR